MTNAIVAIPGRSPRQAEREGTTVSTTPEAEPEVLSVVDLVQYQAATVVSRTLVKKPTGTVTAFAFDVNEGLSEHTAPFDALVFVTDGEAEISIAGTPYRVRAGEMLRLPANRPHALRAVQRFKMLLVMIRE
jgi:quercetin dioxygenase-like cupin family protein